MAIEATLRDGEVRSVSYPYMFQGLPTCRELAYTSNHCRYCLGCGVDTEPGLTSPGLGSLLSFFSPISIATKGAQHIFPAASVADIGGCGDFGAEHFLVMLTEVGTSMIVAPLAKSAATSLLTEMTYLAVPLVGAIIDNRRNGILNTIVSAIARHLPSDS